MKLDKAAMAEQLKEQMASAGARGPVDRGLRAAKAEAERMARMSTMPLAEIQDRPHGDTRPTDKKHVESLAENIAAIGLLEPLVTDSVGRLIAGANRLAALRLLAESPNPPSWISQPIPIRRLPFDAEKDPDRALAAEVAENTNRRGYLRTEINGWIERLRAAGYREKPGRPKKGEKALKPALAVIVGRSIPTVERMLAESKKAKTPSDDGVSPPPGPDFRVRSKSIRRALAKALEDGRRLPRDKDGRAVVEGMRGLISDIDAWLEKV